MGILEDYIGESLTAKPIEAKRGGILEQYINDMPTKKVSSNPKPPISGISKEASDELNQTRLETKGGENPRPGIGSVPVKAGASVYEAAKAGILEAGQGLGETLSGKPATGLGNVGMGLMGIVSSPFEGVGSVVSDLTGNKNIGNKAAFVTGSGIPIRTGAGLVSRSIPKNKALSDLVEDITSGGKDYQSLIDTVTAMKADPRIGPADVSPTVLGATQKLFVKDGDVAKNYLHKTSKERLGKLGDDVTAAFDEAAGTPVNVVNKLNELSAAAKKAGSDIINPALKATGPVNISKSIDAIDNVLKPGIWKNLEAESSLPFGDIKEQLQSIRNMLANKKEMLTDAETLHGFQYRLRERASSLQNSSVSSERELGKELMKVRDNVVNDINAASPKIKIMKDGKETEVGQYKHGLSVFREEKDLADAFREGYQSTAKGMEKDPNFTKKWFDSLTEHEKEAAREGKRLSISHKMGRAENPSLAGTKVARSEFDKKELEIFFGKEETDKLLSSLENTRAIKNTDQKIIEGSQTAARMAADKKSDLPVKDETNPLNKYVTPAAAAGAEMFLGGGTGLGAASVGALATGAKVGSAAAFKIKTALAKERNAQYAKLALPTEGPSRDALIKALEAHIPGPKQSIMTRGANSLSRIVGP